MRGRCNSDSAGADEAGNVYGMDNIILVRNAVEFIDDGLSLNSINRGLNSPYLPHGF